MLSIYFGRRGSGKTTSIRAIVPSLKKPVLIVDILGNFQGYSSHGVPWTNTTYTTQALKELFSYLKEPNGKSGIITLQTGNIDIAVDFFSSALWKIGGGTLVVDEGDAFTLGEAPCFDEAIRYGRNRGIDMVFGCRRPAEITKNVTAGADIAYIFATQEPRDIEYYEDYLGDELAFKISNLAPHHGVYRDFLNLREGEFFAEPSGLLTLRDVPKTAVASTRRGRSSPLPPAAPNPPEPELHSTPSLGPDSTPT